MKTIELSEAQSRLSQLFDEAQAGSPVLLVHGGQVAKLERVEPPQFGGDPRTLEKMLLDAVRGPHNDWTPQDLDDIARRVRERRGQ
jgi:antitoxin (DNA-binding transcriptional repressor) of toxin-antitoxin stability system